MSTQLEDRPMMECEVCQLDVPAGEYCGLCGAPLSQHSHDGPHWLRARSFSAAPGQHLLRLSITSSLFPHLSPRSRTSFMLGLVALVLVLVATAMLRLPGALVAVAVLGLPVIFGIYLRESEFNQDAPRGNLWLTAVLSIALGVGWALLTGAAAARSYGIPLGAGIAAARVLRMGVGVTLGGLLLMQVPALTIRLLRPGHREALHGYAIGAHAAIYFTAAATLTRLAPQFGTGMISRDRPMQGLAPRLRAVRRGQADASAAIGPGCIAFSPQAFEVAPHDFEKLTVTVAVPADTPAGDYEVVFALGDDEPDLKMGFAVVAG